MLSGYEKHFKTCEWPTEKGKHALSVMSHHGDQKVEWDEADPETIKVANEIFRGLIDQRNLAFKVKRGGEGAGEQVNTFDPKGDYVFVRQLQGG